MCFGMVAEEKHAASPQTAHRALHHHCPVFCTEQHHWNKVAKLSLVKYRVPLNAVRHNSYTEMYQYLRQPSAKKPLSELDSMPFYSRAHPQGESLQTLLEVGQRAATAQRGKLRLGTASSSTDSKRQRLPSLFETIRDNALTSGSAFVQYAHAEANEGRPMLAEWATRNGSKIDEIIANVHDLVQLKLYVFEHFSKHMCTP
jgi:hypothetical protein